MEALFVCARIRIVKSEETMMESDLLSPEIISQIKKIDRADILIGIPSFRNAKTIAKVVKAASQGVVKYFPDLKPVLVNADGGSEDKTPEIVFQTPVPEGVKKIVTPYQGLPGKGSAFRTIFDIADQLKAKICIVVDSDLRSITPEWIKLLGEPIHKYNFGYVTPYYLRYKYDGTITNSLAYPLTRALYGVRIRQPIGGEFGFTGGLARVFAHQKVWDTDIARYGIDIWMTTTAICEGFRICQSSMGVKLHDPKDPSSDLTPMFKQVTGTLFGLMKKYEVKWKAVRGSVPVETFGQECHLEPKGVTLTPAKMIERFKQGYGAKAKLWEKILLPENYHQITALIKLSEDDFYFPVELWTKVVYDFAVAFNFSSFDPDKVIESFIPLYNGRTAAYVIETRNLSGILAEALVEGGAQVFERLKPYLVKRWDEAKKRQPGA